MKKGLKIIVTSVVIIIVGNVFHYFKKNNENNKTQIITPNENIKSEDINYIGQ